MIKNSSQNTVCVANTKFPVGADLRVCPKKGEHIGSPLRKTINGEKR
jgi:hypothetical protein